MPFAVVLDTCVLYPVAAGLTNPEVGLRLYVSRRTVETHLAHIFRKLDLVSRAQLASEFTRRDIAKSPV